MGHVGYSGQKWLIQGQNFWCGTVLGANSGVGEFFPKLLVGANLRFACVAVRSKSATSFPGEIFVMGVLWVKIVWLYTSETLASFADQVSCSSGLGRAISNSTGGLGHFWAKLLP